MYGIFSWHPPTGSTTQSTPAERFAGCLQAPPKRARLTSPAPAADDGMEALLAAAEAAGATALAEEISPTGWDGAFYLGTHGISTTNLPQLVSWCRIFWMPSTGVLVCDFVFLEWGFLLEVFFLAEYVGWWWWWGRFFRILSLSFCPDLGENG